MDADAPKQGRFTQWRKKTRRGDNYLITNIGFEFVIGSRHKGLGPSSCAGSSCRERGDSEEQGRNCNGFFSFLFSLVAVSGHVGGDEAFCCCRRRWGKKHRAVVLFLSIGL